MVDFYDADQLAVAKSRLSDDIESLNLDAWSRPAQHRHSDKQAWLEAADIFGMLTFLDEKMQLDNLPIYVCEDVDRVPSVKWMDGDFMLLMAKMSNLHDDNESLKMQLIEIMNMFFQLSKDVQILHSKVDTGTNGCIDTVKVGDANLQNYFGNCCKELADRIAQSRSVQTCPPGFVQQPLRPPPPPAPARPVEVAVHKPTVGPVDNRMQCEPPAVSVGGPVGPRPSSAGLQAPLMNGSVQPGSQIQWTMPGPCTQPVDYQPPQQQQRHANWSDQAAGPSQPPRGRLSSYGRSTTAAESDDDGGEYQVVQGRRYRRQIKRRRDDTGKPATPTSFVQPRIKVIGKSQTGSRITASGNIVEKRVFCVSNVATDRTTADMTQFLQDNGIKVVTCHDTKSKFDGKAFRVCIVAADCERFLSEDIWPENVVIRQWFFKEKSSY
jgi:hypothetical protein